MSKEQILEWTSKGFFLDGIPCRKLEETGQVNDYPAGNYKIYDGKFLIGKTITGLVVLEILNDETKEQTEKA